MFESVIEFGFQLYIKPIKVIVANGRHFRRKGEYVYPNFFCSGHTVPSLIMAITKTTLG